MFRRWASEPESAAICVIILLSVSFVVLPMADRLGGHDELVQGTLTGKVHEASSDENDPENWIMLVTTPKGTFRVDVSMFQLSSVREGDPVKISVRYGMSGHRYSASYVESLSLE